MATHLVQGQYLLACLGLRRWVTAVCGVRVPAGNEDSPPQSITCPRCRDISGRHRV